MAFAPKRLFITGGGSGIGRGLAEAFAARGIPVVIAGRREGPLREVCAAHRNIEPWVMDVTRTEDLERAARELPARFPDLDCLVNNAGVQRPLQLDKPQPLDFPDLELDANVRAPLRLTAALLPHLLAHQSATVINVTSGLAHVPLARVPVYSATKAFMHSYSVSLRHQLRNTAVRVVELSPPAVQTELHDYMGAAGRSVGIPLDAFVSEAMEALLRGDEDIHVADAKRLHEKSHTAFQEVFKALNP